MWPGKVGIRSECLVLGETVSGAALLVVFGHEREEGGSQTPRDAEVHTELDVDSFQVWGQAAGTFRMPKRRRLRPGSAAISGMGSLRCSGTRWRSARIGLLGLSLRRT